jgi:hypothetical protein
MSDEVSLVDYGFPDEYEKPQVDQGPAEPQSAHLLDSLGDAIGLAAEWTRNALNMLSFAHRAAAIVDPRDPMGRLSLKVTRRHFHTERTNPALTEENAIQSIRTRFETIRRFLSAGDAVFRMASDAEAENATRGYFGSQYTVAAYAYSWDSVSLTSRFPSLGPKCRAAVIIHQLAHFMDARVKDMTGAQGAAYDRLSFESALLNVHCYPNFAVNASPPYGDERFGLMRPDE